MKNVTWSFVVVAALALAGCSDDTDGRGAIAFSTWGEEYIEREIPAADVEDGWTIRYSRFLIVLRHVTVADSASTVAASMSGSKLYDLVRPGVKPVVTFTDVPAKAWTHVSYEIGPATPDTEVVDATEDDKQRMLRDGYSVYVEGTASKEGTTKSFAWGFTTATLYDECEGALGGKLTPGVVVTNGGTDRVELTIHGDHLFYDDLQASNAKLRFESIAAADADGDGAVTLAELSAVSLASIPAERGPYGTGSAAGIHDLRGFVEALSRTLGHFRGEGECFSKPL